MWEVLNPHRGGSHVLKKDFDDWIKFARSEKQVLQEEMKTSSVQSLWAALTNETLSVEETISFFDHLFNKIRAKIYFCVRNSNYKVLFFILKIIEIPKFLS